MYLQENAIGLKNQILNLNPFFRSQIPQHLSLKQTQDSNYTNLYRSNMKFHARVEIKHRLIDMKALNLIKGVWRNRSNTINKNHLTDKSNSFQLKSLWDKSFKANQKKRTLPTCQDQFLCKKWKDLTPTVLFLEKAER